MRPHRVVAKLAETLDVMSCKEAAQFVGVRLITLSPKLKEIFKDYFWTDGGSTPPKLI